MRLTALADGTETAMSDDLPTAVAACEARDAARRTAWRERFGV